MNAVEKNIATENIPEIEVTKTIGLGWQNICYLSEEFVYKVTHILGDIWTNTKLKYIKKSLEALEEKEVNCIQAEILEKVYLTINEEKPKLTTRIIRSIRNLVFKAIGKDPTLKENVIKTPYIENIDQLTITFENFIDKEKGPDTIREAIKMLKQADSLYREDNLGLDPYGGEILLRIVEGYMKTIMLKISDKLPDFIQEFIQSKIKGIKGEMKNFIWQEEEETEEEKPEKNIYKKLVFMLIDIGLHDFSKKGKIKLLTKLVHHLTFAGLILIIKYANERMDETDKVSQEEIDSLEDYFNGTPKHMELAKKLFNIMTPLFLRHIEDQKSAQSC